MNRSGMIGRKLSALAFAILSLSLLTSFARPALDEAPDLAGESTYRVTRHFAAGLEYLVVEPPDLPADAELPMVVFIHGRSSVPTPPTGAFYGIATPVRVILPRGPERSGDGYSWMPVSAHFGESPPLVDAMERSTRMLAEAMIQWRHRHPTRGKPIVVGFSQGGMLAANLALRHADSIAGAFPIAAWVPPSLMPGPIDRYAAHAPIHALHGADDPVLSAPRTRATFARLRALGYEVSYEEIDGAGHEVDDRMAERLRDRIEALLEQLPETARSSGNS
jgi:phospholipase/carboxylesterase